MRLVTCLCTNYRESPCSCCEMELNCAVVKTANFLVILLLIAWVENAAGGFKLGVLYTHQYSAPIFINIQELNNVLSLGFRVNHLGAN